MTRQWFLCRAPDVDHSIDDDEDKPSAPCTFPDINNPSDSSAPTSLSPPSDVFRLSLRDLPDAVLGCGVGRLSPPNALPRRDEVGVATGVREGIGGAAGTPATLEG